jgi:hypothetical protein
VDVGRLLRIAARVAAAQYRRDLKFWPQQEAPPVTEAPQYWRQDIPQRVLDEAIASKLEQAIKWKTPDLEAEQEKFQRIAESLGLDVSDIQSKAGRGHTCQLSPQIWSMLANSESWTIESMEEAEKRAALRDIDLQPVLDAVAAGQTISAPVVLILGDGTPHLVSGDDRLMIARAMDIEAQVFFVDMTASDKHSDVPNMPVTGYRR